jgi:hypothetical protein
MKDQIDLKEIIVSFFPSELESDKNILKMILLMDTKINILVAELKVLKKNLGY